MHLLTVFSHPIADSYPAAVVSAFHEPVLQEGHTINVLDLHREGFDPRFTESDHAHFWGGPLPADIVAMHRRVEAADRIAFVLPVYWWSMPATMKGWIERVFTGDWAYQYGQGVQDRGKEPLTGLLPRIPTALVGVGGSKRATYDKYGYEDAMRTQLDVGIFAYCGIVDVESHLIYDVEGDHNVENRAADLRDTKDIGSDFMSLDHTPPVTRRLSTYRRDSRWPPSSRGSAHPN